MTPRRTPLEPPRSDFKSHPQQAAAIRTDVAGRQFGNLVTQYRDTRRPHRIVCRCACGRLVHAAVDDLVAGLVDSCGCMPTSPAHRARQVELRQQQIREALFRMMQPTARAGR